MAIENNLTMVNSIKTIKKDLFDEQLTASFQISANNGVSKIENIVRHTLLAHSMGKSDDEIIAKMSLLAKGWLNC